MKKIKDNFAIIMIVIIILLSSLLIGSAVYPKNILPVFILLSLFSLGYYIVKKEKLIDSKIDIVILLLVITSMLILIFKTYTSLSGTIYLLMKYTCFFNIFIIAKHECKKNPQYIHIILNTIIFSIFIQCIFGLDEINGNYLLSIKEKLGYVKDGVVEGRIGGLFRYANVMASVTGMGVFLCWGYMFFTKNIKIKIVYFILSILMLITMLLTYSRLTYIVFAAMCIVFGGILLKKYNIKRNIKFKHILLAGMLVGAVLTYVIIGLNVSDTLNVDKSFRRDLYNVDGEKDYTFSFEIESTTSNKKGFIIEIAEYDVYLKKIDSKKISFGTFSGTKQIKVHTNSETTSIRIKIKNKNEGGVLNVNKMTIDGKEFILKYKLLPTNLVVRIKEIDFNHKSVWQRFVFIRDAFKGIKENWLLGYGGDSWNDLQFKLQEYNYYVKDMHSSSTQIIFENGIGGFVVWVGILVYVIKYLWINIKKNDVDLLRASIAIGVLLFMIHGIFDVDFAYFFNLVILAMLLVSLKDETQYKKENKNKAEKLVVFILLLLCVGIIYISTCQMFVEDTTSKNLNTIMLQKEEYNLLYKLLPFDTQLYEAKYKILNKSNTVESSKELIEIIEYNIEYEKYYYRNLNLQSIYVYAQAVLKNKEYINDKFEKALECVKNTEDISKYFPNVQISRLNNLKEIVELLYDNNQLEYAQKFNNQLKKEIAEKREYILDYKKSKYEKEKVEEYEEKLNLLEEFANTVNL